MCERASCGGGQRHCFATIGRWASVRKTFKRTHMPATSTDGLPTKDCLDWIGWEALFCVTHNFSLPVLGPWATIAQPWLEHSNIHINHIHALGSTVSSSSLYLIQCHSRYDSVSFACRGQCFAFNPDTLFPPRLAWIVLAALTCMWLRCFGAVVCDTVYGYRAHDWQCVARQCRFHAWQSQKCIRTPNGGFFWPPTRNGKSFI